MARRRGGPPAALPSRDAIRRFIRTAPGRVGKREIMRHFGLSGELRTDLRALLEDLAGEGAIAPAGRRRFSSPSGAGATASGAGTATRSAEGRPDHRLPDSVMVVVTGTDSGGDALARPVEWRGGGPPPVIMMAPERPGQPALAPGQRVLARLRPAGPGRYEGRTLRRADDAPGRVLGVYRPGLPGQPGRLVPTDRRTKAEWRIPPGEEGGAEPGEVVLATPLPHPGLGLKPARVVERLGPAGDARAISLICIATHDIPHVFPEDALAEAKRARATPLGRRADLRDVPLVTIDGEDARDFDDAVFAEPDGEGWRLLVAIADVAHYVRPGSALDREAWKRGNSTYFPDRVVPMLPEKLSNGWCSLRPAEDRGCLFVELRVDAAGRKTGHRFGRGLMRSAARLTYEQVQAAADGGAPPDLPADLPPGLIGSLYGAFRALLGARQARGTLELDLPERKVLLDDAGHVAAVVPRPRLDSHRLIEEFMILANVAAAEELETRHLPCLYRVHPPPSDEKLEALRAFLHGLEDGESVSLPPGNRVTPRDLDRVLAAVAGTDQAPLVNEVVLRSQSQASYDLDNAGHFGLALPRYAHFTSPIRRYADLLVHRALVTGLRLGVGGLAPEEPGSFPDTAEHISATERRSALAERDSVDRYLSAYMADKVGARFPARISGVQRFGLFVTLDGTGASGLVPMSSLGDDYWVHDESAQALVGRRTGARFQLAQRVDVRLMEATPITGGLLFAVVRDDALPVRGSRGAGHGPGPKKGSKPGSPGKGGKAGKSTRPGKRGRSRGQ